MKTKFYWVAALASAAMIAQANAGGHHGGGGGGGSSGAHFMSAPMHSAGASSFQPMTGGNFGGNRMINSGQRFSTAGGHALRSTSFRSQPMHIDRGNHVTRLTNANRRVASRSNANRNTRLRGDWQRHVFAQHSANWQRNWDRRHDHWWNGHRCHFVNGSWIIFDSGFDPWWPYWYDDYYAYGYAPYSYGYGYGYRYDPADEYDTNVEQPNEYSDTQYVDQTIAAVQERLAQQGYYRGQIDGVFGAETQRALAHYQSGHGLRVSGALTSDTLIALGLRRVTSN